MYPPERYQARRQVVVLKCFGCRSESGMHELCGSPQKAKLVSDGSEAGVGLHTSAWQMNDLVQSVGPYGARSVVDRICTGVQVRVRLQR